MQTDSIEITITPIGTIPLGVEGQDQYVMLTRLDDDLTEDCAHQWLITRYYRDTNTPGTYFCHRVSIIPIPNNDSAAIGIIHHRYDV